MYRSSQRICSFHVSGHLRPTLPPARRYEYHLHRQSWKDRGALRQVLAALLLATGRAGAVQRTVWSLVWSQKWKSTMMSGRTKNKKEKKSSQRQNAGGAAKRGVGCLILYLHLELPPQKHRHCQRP